MLCPPPPPRPHPRRPQPCAPGGTTSCRNAGIPRGRLRARRSPCPRAGSAHNQHVQSVEPVRARQQSQSAKSTSKVNQRTQQAKAQAKISRFIWAQRRSCHSVPSPTDRVHRHRHDALSASPRLPFLSVHDANVFVSIVPLRQLCLTTTLCLLGGGCNPRASRGVRRNGVVL